MLKKQALKKISITTLALFIVFLISLFPNNNQLNIEETITYQDTKDMIIYAPNNENYISRTNVFYNNDEIVPYIISMLKKDSQESSYLPSFLHPIIPKNTKIINYDIDKRTLKINFSKELLDIEEKDEEKLIESLIYSLCEQENIDNIIIFVEGNILNELPHSHKILNYPLDRSYGINKIYNINNIKDTKKTTLYYGSKYNDEYYYIPITKVSNNEINKVEIIVNELKNIPIYQTKLITFLNASYELTDYEILENRINLSFNNNMLTGLKEDEKIEEVKYTLALSIRDTFNIDNIAINIT